MSGYTWPDVAMAAVVGLSTLGGLAIGALWIGRDRKQK